jgi:hypothetical protein
VQALYGGQEGGDTVAALLERADSKNNDKRAQSTPGGRKGRRPEQVGIVVAREAENVFGYVNRCPHMAVPLDWLPDEFMRCTHCRFLNSFCPFVFCFTTRKSFLSVFYAKSELVLRTTICFISWRVIMVHSQIPFQQRGQAVSRMRISWSAL